MTESLSQILRASRPLELKFAGAGDIGEIEGIASAFGTPVDDYNDVISPGAYTRTLGEHKAAGTLPLMLWSHDPDIPIGRWTEMRQDAQGLHVKGQLNLETEAGRDALAHLKAGDLRGLSIGFRIYPGGSQINDKGIRVIHSIELFEISVVAFPAQRRAGVTSVKSFGSRAELESILREHLPARAVKKLMSGGWPALGSGDEDDDLPPQLERLAQRMDAAILSMKGR